MRPSKWRPGGNGADRPDRIEGDIANTRVRLDEHIEGLRRDLDSGRIVDALLASWKGGAGGFFDNLGRDVRDNPVAAALLASGISWMMLRDRATLARRREQEGKLKETLEDKATELRSVASDTASHLTSGLKERVHRLQEVAAHGKERTWAAAGAVGRGTRRAASGVGSGWQKTRGAAGGVIENEPLTLGILGVAIGALIGLSTKRTRTESKDLEATPVGGAADMDETVDALSAEPLPDRSRFAQEEDPFPLDE